MSAVATTAGRFQPGSFGALVSVTLGGVTIVAISVALGGAAA